MYCLGYILLKPVLCFHHGQCTTLFHDTSSRYLVICEDRTQSCCLLGGVSLSCLCCCAVYSKLLVCEHLGGSVSSPQLVIGMLGIQMYATTSGFLCASLRSNVAHQVSADSTFIRLTKSPGLALHLKKLVIN